MFKVFIITLFIFLFTGTFYLKATRYPTEWWKPIDKAKAYYWEILPQEAKKGEVILSKRN